MKKVFSTVLLTSLIASMLTLGFLVQPVRTSGTIYIRADGSVEGTDKIFTMNNITYTFTDNINNSIVVERDNIFLDGQGYLLQGTGSGVGILLSGRSNVTLRNIEINGFTFGVYLYSSSNNTISGNNITNNNDIGVRLYSSSSNNTISGNTITNNRFGVHLDSSSYNAVSGNYITNNSEFGVWLHSFSNYNTVSGNNITANNWSGIWLGSSSNNNTVLNNIASNNICGIILYYANNNTLTNNTASSNSDFGIRLSSSSNNNMFYHNNFIDNPQQVSVSSDSLDTIWDDGYPSGGNYWSDYAGVDVKSGSGQNLLGSDGLGDTPYTVDASNADHYPLMAPWSIPTTVNTTILKGGETYSIEVISNASILYFNETPGSMKLKVSGEAGTSGYVRIIQPVGLNSSNIKVFLNNTKLTFPSIDPPRSISTNGTHYFIYFAFTFSSTYELIVAFPISGDVDYDGDVDIFDIVTIVGAYGTEEGHPKYNAHCDIDGDGDVDIFDIVIACGHYGESW